MRPNVWQQRTLRNNLDRLVFQLVSFDKSLRAHDRTGGAIGSWTAHSTVYKRGSIGGNRAEQRNKRAHSLPCHVLSDLLVTQDVFATSRLMELSVWVVLRVRVALGRNLGDVFPLGSEFLAVLLTAVAEDLGGCSNGIMSLKVSGCYTRASVTKAKYEPKGP